MCRFTLFVGDPSPVAPLVYGGSHSLHDQSFRPKELLNGTLNADGYAVAWYHEGAAVRVADTRPVWQDDDLEALLATVRSSMAIAAVRNASPGIPYGLAEVAPMILDRWTFTLNGYVREFRSRFMRAFRNRLPDHLHGEIRGTSDTETLFLMALSEVGEGATLQEALASTARIVIRAVSEEGLATQLNMALTDGDTAVVTRTGSLERSNSLYVTESSELFGAGALAASERLDEASAWREIEHDHIVQLVADQPVTVTSLT